MESVRINGKIPQGATITKVPEYETSSFRKCVFSGKRTRTRTCTDPPPMFGGHPCPGKATDEEGCNQEPCEPSELFSKVSSSRSSKLTDNTH